jgi:hypothetical protein
MRQSAPFRVGRSSRFHSSVYADMSPRWIVMYDESRRERSLFLQHSLKYCVNDCRTSRLLYSSMLIAPKTLTNYSSQSTQWHLSSLISPPITRGTSTTFTILSSYPSIAFSQSHYDLRNCQSKLRGFPSTMRIL